jgi:hypothetical protein
MADILARRQVRLAVGAALSSITGCVIETPGDWTTPPDTLPAILYRVPRDTKESIVRSQPEFTTTVLIEIEARIEALSASAAQDAIEALGQQIESAIFTNIALIAIIQQFSSVTTETDISSEGRRHLGGIRMNLLCELFEAFEPAHGIPLTEITVHADLAGTYDANGTYTGSLFPTAVLPAPRTSGPDGRDEGALDIVLPQ